MKFFILLILIFLTFPLWAKVFPLTIYHTNDLHSHFDGIKYPTGPQGTRSQMITAIEQIKKNHSQEIIIGIDAGDFFSGTIYSALASSTSEDFPEYDFFVEQKYDSLTFGNHEFDANNNGLWRMLQKAAARKNNIPFVISNLYLKNSNSPLSPIFKEQQIIHPYLIKQYPFQDQNLKIAFLGVLGPDACLVSQSTRQDIACIGFNDETSSKDFKGLIAHIKGLILKLKEKKVDLIILSLHGGSEEATTIIKDIPEIDLIIAGHTHTSEFSQEGKTIISQTGSYGENLGLLNLKYDSEKRTLQLDNPKTSNLVPLNSSFSEKLEWQKKLNLWRKKSFKQMGHQESPDEVIFNPSRNYIWERSFKNPLASLISGQLLEELNQEQSEKFDLYFTSMGLIRSSFQKDISYTAADIFEVSSVGFDEQLRPGVDVVSFYLTAKELKSLLHFLEIYSHFTKTFFPVTSPNLTFDYHSWGIPFVNRLNHFKLNGQDLDSDQRLLKIGTNRFVANNVSTIKKLTHGFINIIPKDKLGNAISVFPTYPKEYQLLISAFKKNKTKI